MSSGYLASLSFGQRQIRFLELLRPGQSSFAMPLVIEVTGPFDEAAFRVALQAVVNRHDVLRASFPLVDGSPVQAVHDAMAIDVAATRIDTTDRDTWRRQLLSMADALTAEPFDLATGPLIRARLLLAPDHRAGIVVVLHHIVADGASLEILARDLLGAYDLALEGGSQQQDALPLQFTDFADWEQEEFGQEQSPELTAAVSYWRTRLRNAPAVLDLPFDRMRQSDGTTVSAHQSLALDGSIAEQLSGTARRLGATPYMGFLAVWIAVLRRWSALDDLIVTIPVSKRTRPELAELIGPFVDTLPLRTSVDGESRFADLLSQVRQAFLEAMEHKDLPFERIVQAIGIERRSDVIPLMQVLFGAYEDHDALPGAADGSRFKVLGENIEQAAKTDLSMVYRAGPDSLDLWCRYDSTLFDPSTVEGLLAWYGKIAAAVADAPDMTIDAIPLIDEAESKALIARFNATDRPYPRDKTAIDLFFDIAAASPSAVAVQEDGVRQTYAELADCVRRLAGVLAAEGVAKDEMVILAIPHSRACIELMLAVLTLGAVFVPVDPNYPKTRRDELVESVGARIAVAGDAGLDIAVDTILLVDDLRERMAAASPHPGAESEPTDTAYVMFTSGSTGVPKGVAVPHRAIVRLVCNTDFCQFGPETRCAAYSNPSFDASTLEIWAPLLNGGTVVPVDRTIVMDARSLRPFLADNDINLLWMTAGLFQQITTVDPSVFAGERTVITGGDVVNPASARAVLAAGEGSGLRLLNGYGPTENTVFSIVFDIDQLADDQSTVPIGRPIANSTAYVLDPNGRPAPVGVVGEICVGGDGVALGYIGDPGRTGSRFPPDPFSGQPGARMYRTGDLGRWRSDGVIQFFGRADNQVKVRGFRVELNEVSAALGRHPEIGAVAVIAPRQASGARQLVAYVVAKNGGAPSQASMRTYLQSRLPSHMLPHAYVVLDELPLTINGKVDTKALPPVEEQHFDRSDDIVAPRSHEEHVLGDIWKDLLGHDEVGVRDNFFRIGGDSILAIRMVARAFDAGLSIALKDVFEHQTIETLAGVAATDRPQRATGSGDHVFAMDLVPLAADPTGPFALASMVLDRSIGSVELGFAVQHLAERHDGLRLRTVADGSTRRLAIDEFLPAIPVRFVDVPGLEDGQVDDWVDSNRERLSRGLDLTTGVTIVATVVNRPPNLGPVVTLALHRAVADDRALMLLAAELDAELRSGLEPRRVTKPAATYRDWLNWLQSHTSDKAVRDCVTRLETGTGETSGLTFTAGSEPDDGQAEIWLGPATVRSVTNDMPKRHGVSPLDPILAALATALAEDGDGDQVAIEVIDGRRVSPVDAPATDTVFGNLEAVLPIRLAVEPGGEADRLRAAKIARQAVEPIAPVYRTLQTTIDFPDAQIGLAWRPSQLTDKTLRLHQTPTFSPSVRGVVIAEIVDGRLHLQWAGAQPKSGAAIVLGRIADELAAFTDWSSQSRAPLHTPFDFPLTGLSADQLSDVAGEDQNIQDIYPLSPMQEAMLVHSLTATGSEVNFEQSCKRFSGDLDVAAFQRAWTYVFHRHPVLRTAFRWRGLDRPVQVVHRDVPTPLTVETWPAFSGAKLEARLADDRALGFDMEAGQLVRMTLIRTAPDEAYLIASFHHLLVDGWCLSRLEWEVRAAYEAFHRRTEPMLEPVRPYRDYIAWLADVDRAAMRRFFAERLAAPPDQMPIRPVDPERGFSTARLVLDRDASRSLNGLVRRRGLTIGALAHLAWGLWSATCRGQRDTVFCTTVSGRPPTISGVEQMVGLFINNLPLRLRFDDHTAVGDLVGDVQAQLGDLQSHAYISPLEVLEAAEAADRAAGLFDTLVVVENVPSGTSAWAGAANLTVESVHGTLKTAYGLTFVVVPGEEIALSLVLPDADGSAGEAGREILDEVAALLTALPQAIYGVVGDLPLPTPRSLVGPRQVPPDQMSGSLVDRPRSTLEAVVADAVAAMVDGEIGLVDDFAALGLTSLGISGVAARLSSHLGRPVPVTLLLEHRSIATLAAALAKGQAWDAVVPMSGQSGEPFVCVHPIAGDVSAFLDLSHALPEGFPLWALQAPGLEEGQTPIGSVEGLAAANLAALAGRGLPAPRWLGGYSFGGIVAFEMARQLDAQGMAPDRLVLIDTPAPLGHASVVSSDRNRAHAEWLMRIANVRARYHDAPMPFSLDDLLRYDRSERVAYAVKRLQADALLPLDADVGWLTRAHRTVTTLYDAFLSYAPARDVARDLPIGLIRASQHTADDLDTVDARWLDEPTIGWSVFVDRPVDVIVVDGDHVSIMTGQRVAAVAQAITGLLANDGSAAAQ